MTEGIPRSSQDEDPTPPKNQKHKTPKRHIGDPINNTIQFCCAGVKRGEDKFAKNVCHPDKKYMIRIPKNDRVLNDTEQRIAIAAARACDYRPYVPVCGLLQFVLDHSTHSDDRPDSST